MPASLRPYRQRLPANRRIRRRLVFESSVVADTTPPVPNITVSPSATRISRVVGKDATTFTFRANEAIQAWKVKVVSSSSDTESMGTLVDSGGAAGANADVVVEITDDELVAASSADGSKLLKVFVQDLAGNWSTA